MKRVVSILIAFAAAPIFGQGVTHLTFQEAMQRALQVNNSVERAHAEIDVQEQNRQLLISNVLPRVNVTGSAVRNSDEVTFGNGSDRRTKSATSQR